MYISLNSTPTKHVKKKKAATEIDQEEHVYKRGTVQDSGYGKGTCISDKKR